MSGTDMGTVLLSDVLSDRRTVPMSGMTLHCLRKRCKNKGLDRFLNKAYNSQFTAKLLELCEI